VLNRKADGYASPDLVNQLYERYRVLKYDIDQLRKKRNEHAAALKNVLLIEDEEKKETLMESHHKIGKSFKTDLQQREKDFEGVEAQFIQDAMKLPNKTHPDSPVGSEDNNRIVKMVGAKPKNPTGISHLQIAEEFDLLDF
jgi:seryl-tRNA synthetase